MNVFKLGLMPAVAAGKSRIMHSLVALTACAMLVKGATITGPSYLHVNLSYMSFGYYFDDIKHLASSYNFTRSCPSGSTVRGCIKTILGNMRAQGVSGVRIFVPLCEGDTSISPLTNCGQSWQNVSFNAFSGPGHTWIQNATAFFGDVKAAGIQNVTITIVHGTPAGGLFSLPSSQTTSPGGQPCADTPATVYFFPSTPYGLKPDGNGSYLPIGQDIRSNGLSNAYNCAPINPYFIGWTNQFNAISSLLAAAVNQVTIDEFEFEQELGMSDFTVQLRYLYDNAHTSSYTNHHANCPTTTIVDIVCVLQDLMAQRRLQSGNVTYSSLWYDTSDPTLDNCLDFYQDYARQINVGSVASAFGAGYVGVPDDATRDGYGLWCGGTDLSSVIQAPFYHSQPNLVDAHIYPQLVGTGTGDTMVQQVAQLDYSDLNHFVGLVNPSALVMIGETHNGTQYDGMLYNGQPCAIYPNDAATNNVAGFNSSTLAGHSIVFRPWMELEDPSGECYPYPTYQNVNLNWTGPYTPTIY